MGSSPTPDQTRNPLRVIFEDVDVNAVGKRLVCVKPYPQFVALFRMDGLIEKGGVSMSRKKQKGLDPRVERLLKLIAEAKRARMGAASIQYAR